MASNPASSKSDFLERLSADFTAPVIEACITIDEQQRVVAINPAALRMFGYAGDQILGEEVTRLIPARFQNQHRQQVAGFAGSGDRERPMGAAGTPWSRDRWGAVPATVLPSGRSIVSNTKLEFCGWRWKNDGE